LASDSHVTEQSVHGQCAGMMRGVMLLLVVLALSQAIQAWNGWQGRGADHTLSPGPTGSLYSVSLVNGAVYYGRLVEAPPGYVKLADVYYVENYVVDNKGGRDNRLVNRQKNDWHGPEWMAIPVDKVLLMEKVGAQSRVAKLIDQEKVPAVVK
jgi:hypothetical protein